MGSSAEGQDQIKSSPFFTLHATRRMQERNISQTAVDLALGFGRMFHVSGATIYAIGRKQVEHCRHPGMDLAELEGIQVVCNELDKVMTVYRNGDFSRLRPRRQKLH